MDYDYIIAGAGAAGLSLAYHLGQSSLADHSILLVDPNSTRRNDRTWCFWETGSGPFEAVVSRRWDHLWLHDEYWSARLAIAPYQYKLIQGIDFYRFVDAWMAQRPQITRIQGTVERFIELPDGVAVVVGGKTYTARFGFNSVYRPQPTPPGYHSWLQHFKGWVITTPQPVFDAEAATFMDFRIPQVGDVRFGYVLPFDTHTALVEYTIFSPQLVSQAEYEAGLQRYIAGQLGIDRYEITHVEYGVIPMSDVPLPVKPSPHVLNIGTAGGMSKPSTGYTFQRIQWQTRQIVESLIKNGHPFYPQPRFNRHALMDSILLNVLDAGRTPGHRFFANLFRNNPIQRVLRFLDEETTLAEDVALMSTVELMPFVFAAMAVFWGRVSALSRRELEMG
ncbi:lycopene cyclase family protein [Chloroflexus sp.]|uniref:lycopene cyclase family protein n=1 Tax=Chloroflexus sp. TaxID=1904827 RepID=UPI002618EA4F|nr:lycopene cyclase family protein [uncultured Chloroflexus sp.]